MPEMRSLRGPHEALCLVGACVATGDKIFATGSDTVSNVFCDPVAVFA